MLLIRTSQLELLDPDSDRTACSGVLCAHISCYLNVAVKYVKDM